jgi:serine/threonine-protein kinase RsbW/stage II sporulation protein AB (anti-sigma F factor)
MAPPVLELTLPARPESVAEIRAAVRQFAVQHGVDRDVLGSVALAVSEAATNAVVHAFVDRAPGIVRTLARTGDDELIVHIADDGRGMQPRVDSPGMGVGLPIIGQLARTLDIRQSGEAGTELRMSFAAVGVRGTA